MCTYTIPYYIVVVIYELFSLYIRTNISFVIDDTQKFDSLFFFIIIFFLSITVHACAVDNIKSAFVFGISLKKRRLCTLYIYIYISYTDYNIPIHRHYMSFVTFNGSFLLLSVMFRSVDTL